MLPDHGSICIPTFQSTEFKTIFRSFLDSNGTNHYEVHFERSRGKEDLIEIFKDLSRQVLQDKENFVDLIDLLYSYTKIVTEENQSSLNSEYHEKKIEELRNTPSTSNQVIEHETTEIIDIDKLEKDINNFNYCILEIDNSTAMKDLLIKTLQEIIYSKNKVLVDFLDNESSLKTERIQKIMRKIFSLEHKVTKKNSKRILEVYLEIVRLKFIYKIKYLVDTNLDFFKDIYHPNN